MQLTRALLVLAAATSSTLALVLPAPLGLSPSPLSLPTGTVTCGSHKFSVSSVSAAVAQGYKYYKAGSTVGSDKYPHIFRDDEKLSMYCSGSTWYEFPIMSGGALYTGGSPGADRIIFNPSGTYCAVITHTGSSQTNGFVACQGD